jgi:hypothetical protein
MGAGQAMKITLAKEIIFRGCAVMNFKTKLPFHVMREG